MVSFLGFDLLPEVVNRNYHAPIGASIERILLLATSVKLNRGTRILRMIHGRDARATLSRSRLNSPNGRIR